MEVYEDLEIFGITTWYYQKIGKKFGNTNKHTRGQEIP